MIPTGGGVIGARVETPDGVGVIGRVHNQDTVTVTLDKLIVNALKKEVNAVWIGDVGECNGWCGDCEAFHTHAKHTKVKVEPVRA